MIVGRWRNWRRARRARAAPSGPLRDLLVEPRPAPSTDAANLRLLAVDLETTGLDPTTDHIVAIGFIPVDGGSVIHAGARYLVVAPPAEVGESATVHGLTDDAVAAGVPLGEALPELLRALRGRVLLAHHAVIESGFLSSACRAVFGTGLTLPTVDTLQVQLDITGPTWGEPRPGSLRLQAARDHFGLPRYPAHNALTDALACAELYLAQSAHLAAGGPLTLRRLTH